ncbi:MAG: sensor histidine kinase [Gemmatimonadota bacterium]
MRREAGVPAALVAAALVGVWLVPGLLAGSETYAFWLLSERATPPWRAFAAQAPGWLAFGLLTPAILWLGERLRARPWPGVVRFAAHLLLALGLGSVYALVAAVSWTVVLPGEMPFRQLVLSWYLAGLPTAVLSYFAVLGAGRAVYWFWRNRQAEVTAARLETQLSDARLDALRMQLDPHFFFNSLNTVTVLVRDGDSASAEEVMELLGELMRETLRGRRKRTASLAEEIAFVRRYLAIEQKRFSDRLEIEIDLPPELAEISVPAFLLQPLVENAVRHGIARRPGAGRIGIAARRDDGRLVLRVEDDGPGPEARPATDVRARAESGARPEPGARPPLEAGAAVGLANTRARLDVLYGDRATCELFRADGGGAVAEVRLPLEPEPSDG